MVKRAQIKNRKILEKIKENVIQGRRTKNDKGFAEVDGFGKPYKGQPAVQELIKETLKKGVRPALLIEALSCGMKMVGEKFKNKEYFIPDMLASAQAVDSAMKILAPFLKTAKIRKKNQIILLATVHGDVHDIGKKIVGYVLKGEGLEVIDAGIDISAEKIAEKIREKNPQILGLSALLNTTMLEMKNVIEILEKEGLRTTVKIIVGGAPLSEDFARIIGADGYASDAFSGAELVKNLLADKK